MSDWIDNIFLGEIIQHAIGLLGKDEWVKAWAKASGDLFGDLGIMRHHATPFWNPTIHKLDISSLGIPGHTHVQPGEHLSISIHYTIGGKQAAIYQVAPQLQALPLQDAQDMMLAPLTYSEWCTFMAGVKTSPCCKQSIVWADAWNSLVCIKCGSRV